MEAPLATGVLVGAGRRRGHRLATERPLQVDVSKYPISPQLGVNKINDLAPAEGASGEVFRTLQVAHAPLVPTMSSLACTASRPTSSIRHFQVKSRLGERPWWLATNDTLGPAINTPSISSPNDPTIPLYNIPKSG